MAFDAGAFTSLLPSFFQGGLGIFQSILGAANKPQRPVIQVPESVRQSTNIAENLASGDMPGLSSIKGQIDLGAGTALNTLQESIGGGPGMTGAVADILGKTNEAKTNLGVQNANFKVGAQQNLQEALGTQGAYEDKIQADKMRKYQEESAAGSALTQAGIQNIFDTLSNVSGVASYNSLYDKLFPKQKEATFGDFGASTGVGGVKNEPVMLNSPSNLTLKNIPNVTNPYGTFTPTNFLNFFGQ